MIRFIQSLNIVPRWLILLIDIGVLSFSFILAYLFRFDFDLNRILDTQFTQALPFYLFCNVIAILATKSYAGIIRHTGLQDGYKVAYTSTIGIILVVIINYTSVVIRGQVIIPLGVITMAYLNSIIFLISYRITVKYVFAYYTQAIQRNKKVNAFIVGTGKSGLITKQIIDSDSNSTINPVAFIEDNSRKIGKIINGLPIYNAGRNLEKLILDYKVKELIISDMDLSVVWKNEIVDLCLKNDVKVRSVPPTQKWIKGELSLNQIKEVKIDDLLGRESIKLDSKNVNNELRGKRVIITGAAGSIGSELVRQVLMYKPSKLLLLDQAESALFEIQCEISKYRDEVEISPVVGDVCNFYRLDEIFGSFQPDIVFHAAAYKHVPMMEDNPSESVMCNVVGTKNLTDLALHYDVQKFVMISTDKAVNPTSIMGATKRIAEMYVQSANSHARRNGKVTAFITTRFGNVLGSNGSVIPLFKKQIERREAVTVTHPEVTRYFMTIGEACQLVLEACAMGKGGEIFLFDMGESIKIVDLAKKMIKLSGLELGTDITIEFTGLRAGEKLYEELLNDNRENILPTHHPKILIAEVMEEQFELIREDIEQLVNSISARDELGLVELMKSMVPDYKSNISKFEQLDNPPTESNKMA